MPNMLRMCRVVRPMSMMRLGWRTFLAPAWVGPSFIPPQPQRDLRELTRERTNFVRQRATLLNRVQKTLESANVKLGTVVTDMQGRSARAILTALAGGETDAACLAALAQGRLRSKRDELEQALQGRL